MLTNEQMTPNRFAKWAEARRKIAWVKARLAEGKTVYVRTMTKTTACKAKHAELFFAKKSGAYLKWGNCSVCIDYCNLVAQ